MDKWVFVDTCIWASFFDKPGSTEKAEVDALIDADRVALVGPVVAEVLTGFRRTAQANWVASRLRMAHYIEAEWNDWRAVAELGRKLAATGDKLPVTDLVLAVVAMRCKASVYSTDPHFDLIPEVKRFSSSIEQVTSKSLAFT